MAEVSYKQCSLLLECPGCSVLNYMDPFSFWNFIGKTKCAGCDAVYAVSYSNGQRVKGPDPAQGHLSRPARTKRSCGRRRRCAAGPGSSVSTPRDAAGTGGLRLRGDGLDYPSRWYPHACSSHPPASARLTNGPPSTSRLPGQAGTARTNDTSGGRCARPGPDGAGSAPEAPGKAATAGSSRAVSPGTFGPSGATAMTAAGAPAGICRAEGDGLPRRVVRSRRPLASALGRSTLA